MENGQDSPVFERLEHRAAMAPLRSGVPDRRFGTGTRAWNFEISHNNLGPRLCCQMDGLRWRIERASELVMRDKTNPAFTTSVGPAGFVRTSIGVAPAGELPFHAAWTRNSSITRLRDQPDA